MTKEKQKPHIHVSAGLIQKDGRFLITKRPKGGHLEGYWEFPGGKQEKGESLKGCLEREIKEELGLKIRAHYVPLTVVHEYETKVVSLHVLDCTILGGEPRAIECQEFRWVAPADFHNYEFPPPDMKVIEFLSAPPASLP
ncbi:MAG: (deoxy)nucleoside triphosphate pyrophosphohydrolase [Deltaproteobacteria bacterium]|nr:(deoxy)nucleoside triphosphate pyrophosphohydrolase [Deltaproteobacteria bacterium]MBW2143626.1 (deoxy)nucleoside triphosphate pyrophosphohydrolase [Deltaproteobacteria bacterium]